MRNLLVRLLLTAVTLGVFWIPPAHATVLAPSSIRVGGCTTDYVFSGSICQTGNTCNQPVSIQFAAIECVPGVGSTVIFDHILCANGCTPFNSFVSCPIPVPNGDGINLFVGSPDACPCTGCNGGPFFTRFQCVSFCGGCPCNLGCACCVRDELTAPGQATMTFHFTESADPVGSFKAQASGLPEPSPALMLGGMLALVALRKLTSG